MDWGYNSKVQCLPSTLEGQGSSQYCQGEKEEVKKETTVWQRRLRVTSSLLRPEDASAHIEAERGSVHWRLQCPVAQTIPIPVSAQLVCPLTESWRIRERPGLRNY